MRVVVVDDSPFMRRAISRMLDAAPDIEVVATARDGADGLEKVKAHRPDVVTLDIEMPEMDGLTALRHIKRTCDSQVLMLSSLTTEGSHAALRAMRLGAADVLAKDTSQVSLKISGIQNELIAKVRALAGNERKPHQPAAASAEIPNLQARQFDVICIGSSTGGPPVLETLLEQVPATLRVPIVIAQHMPPVFTTSMAERFDQACALPVIHVEDRQPLEPGHVYIAPGGRHLHLMRTGLTRRWLRVSDTPADALYHPSVDVLFSTAADTTKSRTLAIQLTGMGCDGLEGAKRLHAQGATILAQSHASCVVYGMPKGVTEQGLATASLDPPDLARTVASLAESNAARPITHTATRRAHTLRE